MRAGLGMMLTQPRCSYREACYIGSNQGNRFSLSQDENAPAPRNPQASYFGKLLNAQSLQYDSSEAPYGKMCVPELEGATTSVCAALFLCLSQEEWAKSRGFEAQ